MPPTASLLLLPFLMLLQRPEMVHAGVELSITNDHAADMAYFWLGNSQHGLDPDFEELIGPILPGTKGTVRETIQLNDQILIRSSERDKNHKIRLKIEVTKDEDTTSHSIVIKNVAYDDMTAKGLTKKQPATGRWGGPGRHAISVVKGPHGPDNKERLLVAGEGHVLKADTWAHPVNIWSLPAGGKSRKVATLFILPESSNSAEEPRA